MYVVVGFCSLEVSPFPNAQYHSVIVPDCGIDKSENSAIWGEQPFWLLTDNFGTGDALTLISADFFVLFWFGIGILGVLYSGTSERRQRMGDVMANTVVIKNKSSIRYTLKDVLSIKNQENYTPEFTNPSGVMCKAPKWVDRSEGFVYNLFCIHNNSLHPFV